MTTTDDPEGIEVFERVKLGAADLLESGRLIMIIGASDTEINALQRVSSVILQKSLREGFGLTVSEMARRGKEHVRQHFLTTRLLGHYLELLDDVTNH